MEKKTAKRRVIAITVLASLLIALLAFNVTYAYFTDKLTGSAEITFGKVSINATTAISTTNVTNIFPGATFKINGVIDVSGSTDSNGVWVYFGVDKSQITMKIGNTTIAANVQNPNYKDGTSGGHTYTQDDVDAMKNTVETAIVTALATAINTNQGTGANQNAAAWHVDTSGDTMGITTAAVPISTTAFNFANAGTFSLDGNSFGNLFQSVTISFTLEIKAIQATNVQKADAAKAFKSANFATGKDVITNS